MGNCCTRVEQELSGPVGLGHFRTVRYIGRGAFGNVMVVMKRYTQQAYALKERKLLEELESSFICNMRYAFQDDLNLYICLDFMEGGDLRFHLNQKGWFTESVVRYMISEVALGLEYIHMQDVVHRDIKPANVLIDAAGHCYITDFNVAARTRPNGPITGTAGTY
ncbi:MAG: kinase-like domain-containing protein, partial [Olpidium bornovanus]